MAAASPSASPTSPTTNKMLHERPSRFIESEAFTRTPSSRSSPFLSNILSEQDQHSIPSQQVSPTTPSMRSPTFRTQPQLQRKFSWEDSPSEEITSPSSTSPSPLFGRFELPGRTSRTVQNQNDRRSLEEQRRRGKERGYSYQGGKERDRGVSGENIVGRLRALTTGQSTLERKIMAGEVTVYPGT